MKLITLSLLFAAYAGMANAQITEWPKYKSPNDRAKAQTTEMRKNLHLSDSQILKAYDINLKIDKRYDIMDKNVQISSLDRQLSLNKLGSDRDALMECILNDEQYLLYMKKR